MHSAAQAMKNGALPACPTLPVVSLIGLGYIGLPTAATLASRGLRVIGVDVNPRAVSEINAGRAHFVEPELDMLVRGTVLSGRLEAVALPEPADVFILAVPTPFHRETNKPDTNYVETAARSIAPVLRRGNLVVIESTVPVGTTRVVSAIMQTMRPDLVFSDGNATDPDVFVAHCPERILPGHVIRELVENDRTIGGLDRESAERAAAVYRIFTTGRIELCSAEEAEFVKLAENSFRDVNIAFANELSLIADHLEMDVWNIIRMANLHPRVNILNPGPGVGGHCIAVDPWFLAHSAPEYSPLIQTARKVNDGKPQHVIQKVAAHFTTDPDVCVACLGLAFKPDIDDLRESPALDIALHLAEMFPDRVMAVEPNISSLPPSLSAKLNLVSLETAVASCSLFVRLVRHRTFGVIPDMLRPGSLLLDFTGPSEPRQNPSQTP